MSEFAPTPQEELGLINNKGSLQESSETELQMQGAELYRKIQETEKAFQDAIGILSNLERIENRKLLCDSLNQVMQGKKQPIVPEDLEGCKLLTIDREDLKKTFGASFFPVTLSVPIEKWEQTYFFNTESGEKFDIIPQDAVFDKDSEYYPPPIKPPYQSGWGANLRGKLFGFSGWTEPVAGGLFIPGIGDKSPENIVQKFINRIKRTRHGPYLSNYPFNVTGIALYSEKLLRDNNVNAHEDLHRIYEIYSPLSSARTKLLYQDKNDHTLSPELVQKASENSLIDEMNAYREGVRTGELKWCDLEDGQNPNTVFDILVKDIYKQTSDNVDHEKLFACCKAIEYIQTYLPEPVITHILLHCDGFDDLIAWSKVDPGMLRELASR